MGPVAHGQGDAVGPTIAHPCSHIVGDVDGVVIVPKNAIAEVIARVEEKNSGENLFRNAVREGMPPSQAFAKYGVL